MVLTEAKEGACLIVTGTIGDDITLQALRLGIDPGSEIELTKVIPGGPVIVARNQLEIAIGRQLASKIEVELRSI